MKKALLVISAFCFSAALFAQSGFYVGVNTDFGTLNEGTFKNNVLSQGSSGHVGMSISTHLRLFNFLSLEAGTGQYYQNVRLEDQAFEENYPGFSMIFSNRNYFTSYYLAGRISIPFDRNGYIYGQLNYSTVNMGQSSISKEAIFKLPEEDIQQTHSSITNFSNGIQSFIPEVGIQGFVMNTFMLSAGMKLDFSQPVIYSGRYEVFDDVNKELIREEEFDVSANFFAVNLKLAVPLYKVDRKVKEPKEEEPEPEEPEEDIYVKKDEPEKEQEPEADLETDDSGAPTKLNDREVKKSKTMYVSSKTLTIRVWDSGKEVDGDTISLNLNGEWILEDFGLKRPKHSFEIVITEKHNYLMLYALNLGKYPPNTAAVEVWDGTRKQIMQLKSDMATCGALDIIYKGGK